jgi:hypothetical protein
MYVLFPCELIKYKQGQEILSHLSSGKATIKVPIEHRVETHLIRVI